MSETAADPPPLSLSLGLVLPISEGTTLKDGQYTIVGRLGQGRFGACWMLKDRDDPQNSVKVVKQVSVSCV